LGYYENIEDPGPPVVPGIHSASDMDSGTVVSGVILDIFETERFYKKRIG